MRAQSPPNSGYVLDVDGLRGPEFTLWAARAPDVSGNEATGNEARANGALVACGALKELDASHGEIKSMHTHSDWRGHGVAGRFVAFLIAEARRRDYTRLSLETGAMDRFQGARRLYAGHGFQECEPFGSYGPDPHSAFMTLWLNAAGG